MISYFRAATEGARNVLRRENKIHAADRNGAARHRVVSRRFILGEGNPAIGLDRNQSKRAVGRRAGQNHADRAGLILDSKNTISLESQHRPLPSPYCEIFSGRCR
jgi:hypothetical protein